jgi:hypothetical protein
VFLLVTLVGSLSCYWLDCGCLDLLLVVRSVAVWERERERECGRVVLSWRAFILIVLRRW